MTRLAGRLGLLVLLVTGLGFGLAFTVNPAGAQTADPAAQAPVTAETPSTVAASDPAAGGGASSNTPSPVGRLVPDRTQRIADNLAWVWVMAFLVVGGAIGFWLARREDATDPASST